MLTLKGDKVFLRALEPEDLDFIYTVENTEDFWEISSTLVPYSRFIIKKYIQNSHRDIYEVKQLRLMICKIDSSPLGLVDIFDLEPNNNRAAIGILIVKEEERGKGYGDEALSIICKYCFTHLGLHQVYANVSSDNLKSRKLFERKGFEMIGIKKDWIFLNGEYKDEILYQYINVH